MKLFLASSQESLEHLRQLSSWIEKEGHEPLPWDSPSLFLPGESTFQKLIEISKQVDAAIFIFSEDDTVWYRADALPQPRDNVLIEFGIFAGALGQKKAIICTKGSPKTATDLRGITNVDMNMPHRAQFVIQFWLKNLIDPKNEDPTVAILRKELAEVKDQLEFEQEKSRQLQTILTDKNVINFKDYDFSADAHWKLLFDYNYMRSIVDLIAGEFSTPENWHTALKKYGAETVANKISWEQPKNSSRTRMYVAKSLRVFRRYETGSSYENFLRGLKQSLRDSINSVGKLRVDYLSDRGGASEKGSSDTE